MKYLKDSIFAVVPFYIVLFILMLISGTFVLTDYITLTISSLFMLLGMFLLFPGSKATLDDALPSLTDALLKKHSVWSTLLIIFVFTFSSVLSEPNVRVFTEQFVSSNGGSIFLFTLVVSLAAALFLLLSILRCVVKVSLRLSLVIVYLLFFITFIFLDDVNLGAVLDSAGAATGLITVPFITSISAAFVRSLDSSTDSDAYGHLAISSTGVLLLVALYLILFPSNGGSISDEATLSIFKTFINSSLTSLLGIVPFALVYFILWFSLLSSSSYVKRTRVFGFVFMALGVILIFSASSLFVPLVTRLGEGIFKMGMGATVTVGIILGIITALAEPSVSLFADGIENTTSGRIKKNLIVVSIALGLAFTMAVFIIRLYYPFSLKIFFLAMYIVLLILMFFTHPMFIGIAFDSGAVGAGVMSGVILLPYVLSISSLLPNASSGFGLIGGIVAFPILITEILGIIYKVKVRKAENGDKK